MSEKSAAMRLLSGIEGGTLNTADAFKITESLDPVLIHFVIKYLREKYTASNPGSQGVIERLLELTKTYSSVIKTAKLGEEDPIAEWFDDTHSVREFFSKPEEFIDTLVDKIES